MIFRVPSDRSDKSGVFQKTECFLVAAAYDRNMQKIVAEISLRTIEKNARFWKNRTGTRLCAVVKDDAYGHGAAEVVRALEGTADFFAVSNVDEAAEILPLTQKDVLVLTPPATEEEAKEAAIRGCILTVAGEESAAFANRASVYASRFGEERLRVHIKANTGMNRYGCYGSEFFRVCRMLKDCAAIRVEGVYSHLSGIEDRDEAERQRKRFLSLCRAAEAYFSDLTKHLSATGGACLDEWYYFDAVRVGIGLYGYFPQGGKEAIASESYEKSENFLPVSPAMKVYARVVKNGTYRFGTLGYGEKKGAFGEAFRVVSAGYGSGFFRKDNNGMSGGKNANVPCMDAVIRYGNAPFGARECVLSDAEQTAKAAGTIAYEVLCAVGKNAERVYV